MVRGVFSTGVRLTAVVATSLSRSHEKMSAVTLEDESVLGAQAMVGVGSQ